MPNRTDVIPVQFEDGTTIQIQATMLGGMEKVGAKEGGFTFTNVAKSIKSITGEIARVIKDVQPSKATVSMGVFAASSPGKYFTNLSVLQDDFEKRIRSLLICPLVIGPEPHKSLRLPLLHLLVSGN